MNNSTGQRDAAISARQQRLEEIFAWLRANLGDHVIAPITGTDSKAIMAVCELVELWCYTRSGGVEEAFRCVVQEMQRKNRFLAYHLIAMVGDWSFRPRLWMQAGLESGEMGVAAYSPEGRDVPSCVQRRRLNSEREAA